MSRILGWANALSLALGLLLLAETAGAADVSVAAPAPQVALDLSGVDDNTLSTAQDLGILSVSVTRLDFVGTSDVVDHYRFTVTAHVREVTVRLENVTEFAWVELIKDGNGNDANANGIVDEGEVWGSANTGRGTTATFFLWLDPGPYYVRVRPYSSSYNTTYNLTLAETPKPDSLGRADNTLSGARELGVLNDVRTVNDYVGTSDVEDYYHFTVTAPVREVTLRLENVTAYALVELIKDGNGDDANANGIVDEGEVWGVRQHGQGDDGDVLSVA
jgi:hypothetical protein